jgi:hypothetical protein
LLVLIDESGCAGFKLGKGSSAFFVVGMVIFDDRQEAERTSASIQQAKDRLRVKPEFKFSKCSAVVRDGFFAAVASHRFSVRAIVIEKARIYSTYLRSRPDNFYSFFVNMLIQHDGGVLQGASIKIDGSGDREFKRALESYLRQQTVGGKIAKLRFADSHRDNLIQLADMVTGAIARSYSDRSDADRWFRQISSKISNVWEFE